MARPLLLLSVATIGFFVLPAVRGGESEHLLSSADLAVMDRDNSMWRLVRVDDDVETNLRLWRSNGFTEVDVNRLKPSLIAVWNVEVKRNYGWLSQEAIEQIQTVDRKYTAHLRALRLFAAFGIRSEALRPEGMLSLTREWQRAIRHRLDDRDGQEFRLMNSRSALTIARLGEGLNFSTDEMRTLCEWQREFDEQHERDPRNQGYFHRSWRAEDNLEYWTNVRTLLGDARLVVYLSRADRDFDQMNKMVTRLGIIAPTTVLDLWWIKEKREIATARTSERDEAERIARLTHDGAEALLGKVRFAQYSQDETARWLR
ncbi:MAG: hypothetical protein ABI273_18785 [Lacunisphaera sp.]